MTPNKTISVLAQILGQDRTSDLFEPRQPKDTLHAVVDCLGASLAIRYLTYAKDILADPTKAQNFALSNTAQQELCSHFQTTINELVFVYINQISKEDLMRFMVEQVSLSVIQADVVKTLRVVMAVRDTAVIDDVLHFHQNQLDCSSAFLRAEAATERSE